MPQTIDRGLTKDIIIGTAVTSLIFFIFRYLGIFILPLPIVFYRLKLGRSNGAIIPVTSFIVMAVAIGKAPLDLIFLFELLLLGFVLGELMEAGLAIEKTVLYTCFAVIISSLFCLLLYSSMMNTGIFDIILNAADKTIEMMMDIIRKMNPNESVQVISKLLENFKYVLIRILPARVIQMTLISTWVTILIAKPFFKARSIPYPNYGRLNTWKTPDILLWIFIVSGFMLILPVNAFFRLLGLNSIIILFTIYFFRGMAIVSFYFEKKQFPRLLGFYLFGFSFILLQEVLIFFVGIIGFSDIWLDYRKLEKSINTQEN